MFPRRVRYIWLANGHSHSNFSGENQQLRLKAELSKYYVGVEKTNSHIRYWYLYTVDTLGCFENIKNNNCAWILYVLLKMKHQDCLFGLVLTSDLPKPLGYKLTVEMMHWSNLNPESTETKIVHPFAKKT